MDPISAWVCSACDTGVSGLLSKCPVCATSRTDSDKAARLFNTVPHHRVVAGLFIRSDGCIYMQRRALHLHYGGFYELPGGKQKLGETDTETLLREIHEETGATARVYDKVGEVFFNYIHSTLNLAVYHAVTDVDLKPPESVAVFGGWYRPGEGEAWGDSVCMLPADRALLFDIEIHVQHVIARRDERLFSLHDPFCPRHGRRSTPRLIPGLVCAHHTHCSA